MKLQDHDDSVYSSQEKLPEIDERVIVVTRNYRCLGYLDAEKIWRHDTDDVPIENVLQWTRNRRT